MRPEQEKALIINIAKLLMTPGIQEAISNIETMNKHAIFFLHFIYSKGFVPLIIHIVSILKNSHSVKMR